MDTEETETEPATQPAEVGELTPVIAYVPRGPSGEYRTSSVSRMVEEHPHVEQVEWQGEPPFEDVYECPTCGNTTEVSTFMHYTAVGYETSSIRCDCPDDDESLPMRRVD